jgi:hypothetical protein
MNETSDKSAENNNHPINEIEADETLGATIEENLIGQVVGWATDIQPGEQTQTVEVDGSRFSRELPTVEAAEYDTLWLHVRDDSSLALTDHMKVIIEGDGVEPPEEVTYTSVVHWGDNRPNQTLVGLDALGSGMGILDVQMLDTVRVHVDDAGLVALENPETGEGIIVAPQQTSEHPEISKEDIAEYRREKEAGA